MPEIPVMVREISFPYCCHGVVPLLFGKGEAVIGASAAAAESSDKKGPLLPVTFDDFPLGEKNDRSVHLNVFDPEALTHFVSVPDQPLRQVSADLILFFRVTGKVFPLSSINFTPGKISLSFLLGDERSTRRLASPFPYCESCNTGVL